MRAKATIRIRIITGTVVLVACALVIRLYQLQVIDHEAYVEAAEKQYVSTVANLFDRGAIYFSTKNGEEISAASIKSGYVLAMNPHTLKNPEAAYDALVAIVPIDRDFFLKRAKDTSDTYEELAKKLNEEEAVKIKELKLDGIIISKDQWRYYPGDSLASHTIGFVGYDENAVVGKYGLERYYDDILARSAKAPSVNFFAEVFENFGIFSYTAEQKRAGSIITSIEPTVMRTLDAELKAVHEKLSAKKTGGIIMNPKTGDIYALAVEPTFNLNDRTDVTDLNTFRNSLIEDVYEMGSIIKPLTVASGIDAGAITAASTYYDAGTLDIDGYTIYNYDKRGRGTVNMQEVLNQSLNTGVAHIVKTMGRTSFRNYFTKLDFGTETGIDLPSEAHGLVKNLESPRDLEYATASYGQGIAMTPIATVRALAALGNGGVLVTPHVATSIRRKDGTESKVTLPPVERVFTEATSEEISRMLTVVVDKALRGGTKKLEHYSVAAKTGTAQIARVGGKGYYDDRYLHSFFGYFPSYDPTFIIFLYTVEPQNVQYASETLTDPFMNIVQFLINYYNIPPDR